MSDNSLYGEAMNILYNYAKKRDNERLMLIAEEMKEHYRIIKEEGRLDTDWLKVKDNEFDYGGEPIDLLFKETDNE